MEKQKEKEAIGVQLAQQLKRRKEEELTLQHAQELGLPYANLYQTSPEPKAVELIPKELAREARIFAFKRNGGQVLVAIDSPESATTRKILAELKNSLSLEITPHLVSTTSLDYLLHAYDLFAPTKKKLAEINVSLIKPVSLDAKKISQAIKNLPISRALDYLLGLAVGLRASDIHLEPGEDKDRVRLRLDGLLYEVAVLENQTLQSLTNRIKLLSDLKLNIRESAQDGSFSFKAQDQEINVRVSALPTPFGESIVMRLLPEEGLLVHFEELGLGGNNLSCIESAMKQPNGLILNTGPTGSGKTTTLYAILDKLISPETKIVTIEDPIEYRLPGLTQTQVSPSGNYNFASGLRSIVRQDPDVILVGEIRDKETAEIALQASLTGHLVLSTLHTNDAAGALPRLVELGINPNLFAEAVEIIIAQRLVRRICPICLKKNLVEEVTPTPEVKQRVERLYQELPEEIKQKYPQPQTFLRPKGCRACGGLGYKGRIGLFEVLKVTPAITQLVADKRSIDEIRNKARTEGMLTMEADGFIKVLEKITTLDELLRVAKGAPLESR